MAGPGDLERAVNGDACPHRSPHPKGRGRALSPRGPAGLSPSPPVGRAGKTLNCCWSSSRHPPPRETRKRNDSGRAREEGRGGPEAGGVSQRGVLPLAVPPAGLPRRGFKKSKRRARGSASPAATLPGLLVPPPSAEEGRPCGAFWEL